MLDAQNGWAWSETGQLLRTSDGGQSWIARSAGTGSEPLAGFYLDSQTAWQPINFQTKNLVGLLQTVDGGQTWTLISYGPQNAPGPGYAPHFTDALNGWAESAGVGAGNIYFILFSTLDGGKTWATIPAKGPTQETGLPTGMIHLCNICEDSLYYDPARLLIVHGDEGSMQSSGAVRLDVSFDLGNTWKGQNLPLPANAVDAIVGHSAVTFFNGGKGILSVTLTKMDASGNIMDKLLAFYATQDGGASWSLEPSVLDQVGTFPLVQVVSPDDIFALCGASLCASQNGSQTWQQLAANLDFSQSDSRTVLALDFEDARNGWALIKQTDTTQLYQTIDGGINWKQLNPRLTASTPVTVDLTSLPTPTPFPSDTPEASPTP
jgi:photosystem II stability/assembly factor-like uncharacterized protein